MEGECRHFPLPPLPPLTPQETRARFCGFDSYLFGFRQIRVYFVFSKHQRSSSDRINSASQETRFRLPARAVFLSI